MSTSDDIINIINKIGETPYITIPTKNTLTDYFDILKKQVKNEDKKQIDELMKIIKERKINSTIKKKILNLRPGVIQIIKKYNIKNESSSDESTINN